MADITRSTTNVLLPTDISDQIWSNAIEESAFMKFANRINIPGTGTKIQKITGEPDAGWVAEAAAKPVGFHTFGQKTITPYKMAVIEPFSDEFKRDASALYNECVNRLPKSIATKFDATLMSAVAPGSNFDVLGTGVTSATILEDTTNGITVYDRFVDIDAAIASADGIMDTIILAPKGKSILLGAKDGQDRPLFTSGVQSGTLNPVLGAAVNVNRNVYVAGNAASGTAGQSGYVAAKADVVGVAGDFSGVQWGSVEGIKMKVSEQATLTYTNAAGSTVTLNLWQQNMFAVMFEVELAFAVMDKSQLRLLTGETPAS